MNGLYTPYKDGNRIKVSSCPLTDVVNDVQSLIINLGTRPTP